MKNTLRQLFTNHTGKVTDKWTLYVNEWDNILSTYREKEINLLEIGIQNGGSLEIWSEYFQKAKNFIGCDIDDACRLLKYQDPRISIIIGDANTEETENNVVNISDHFDIIIDDGSHKSSDVIKSFARYFPYLADNGIYIIEDTHTSYWKDYEGGLNNPYSILSFLKRLADIVNFEHWRLSGVSRKHILENFELSLEINFNDMDLMRLHSVKFYNSLCVIKKKKPDENILGKRLVVGEEESITTGYKLLNNSQIQDSAPIIEDDHQFDIFSLIKNKNLSDIKIEQLTTDLAERDETIQQLNTDLAEREQSIQQLTFELTEREQSFQQLTANLAERDEIIQHLTDDLAEREQSIQQLTEDLAEREQSIQQLTTDLAERDQTIQQLTTDLAERDNSIQKLTATLAEREQEVLFYATSKSWRITRPLRKLMKKIKGNNHV